MVVIFKWAINYICWWPFICCCHSFITFDYIYTFIWSFIPYHSHICLFVVHLCHLSLFTFIIWYIYLLTHFHSCVVFIYFCYIVVFIVIYLLMMTTLWYLQYSAHCWYICALHLLFGTFYIHLFLTSFVLSVTFDSLCWFSIHTFSDYTYIVCDYITLLLHCCSLVVRWGHFIIWFVVNNWTDDWMDIGWLELEQTGFRCYYVHLGICWWRRHFVYWQIEPNAFFFWTVVILLPFIRHSNELSWIELNVEDSLRVDYVWWLRYSLLHLVWVRVYSHSFILFIIYTHICIVI